MCLIMLGTREDALVTNLTAQVQVLALTCKSVSGIGNCKRCVDNARERIASFVATVRTR